MVFFFFFGFQYVLIFEKHFLMEKKSLEIEWFVSLILWTSFIYYFRHFFPFDSFLMIGLFFLVQFWIDSFCWTSRTINIHLHTHTHHWSRSSFYSNLFGLFSIRSHNNFARVRTLKKIKSLWFLFDRFKDRNFND